MDKFNSSEEVLPKSIWKQTAEGDWKLFFNINSEISSQPQETDQQLKVLFDVRDKKALKMGSLVMTPSGIGRLIKLENKKGTVKFLKDDHESTFTEDLILSEFNIFLRVMEKDYSNWYRLTVPANGSVESLKKTIEEMKIVDVTTCNYMLIYNGLETKDENFFDQMDLRSGSKILLCGLKMTACKIERFNITYNWWYTYNCDGVTFSVNKKIKLGGVGLYGSHEGKIQNGTIKIFEGSVSNIGAILYEEPIEIPAAPEQNNCVTPFSFKKSVNVKPHLDYTIQLICTNYCYLYYGSGGKNTIQGEKNVEFYFKYTPGSSHGTGIESGNFPEFYYYA
jgi:hypothetical protein